MNAVQVYTTTYCPYCLAAKALLDQKGIEYEEINLSGDIERRMKVVKELGWRTVPIIVINDNVIGGYTELKALEAQDKLSSFFS